jgi:hypothetical protein
MAQKAFKMYSSHSLPGCLIKVKSAPTLQNEIWSSNGHDKLLKRWGYLMMLLQLYRLYNIEW